MNIRSETMLATSHSWSITMRNLLLQFQAQKHKLYLKSINGTDQIPSKLMARINRDIQIPDLDICYTMPKNFPIRFKPKSILKIAIYNYESSELPSLWKNSINYLDYVLPSSNFSKEIFLKAGWSEKKCIVIPHGINKEDFLKNDVYKLKTKKKFKFLNISIPHYRKNIDLLIDTYYSTFSGQDDVCLVLKTKLSLSAKPYDFEINIRNTIQDLKEKYKNKVGGIPEIEVIEDYLLDIIPLYKSCDVLINTSSSEGFGLPLLEGLAAGNLVIAPNCSGQIDFLNEKNSLLIDVKEMIATKKYQYWVPTINAKTYIPIKESISEQMLKAFNQKEYLLEEFEKEKNKTLKEFTWKNAADKILALV